MPWEQFLRLAAAPSKPNITVSMHRGWILEWKLNQVQAANSLQQVSGHARGCYRQGALRSYLARPMSHRQILVVEMRLAGFRTGAVFESIRRISLVLDVSLNLGIVQHRCRLCGCGYTPKASLNPSRQGLKIEEKQPTPIMSAARACPRTGTVRTKQR